MSDSKTGDSSEDRYYEDQVRKAADPTLSLDSSLNLDQLVSTMAELALIAPSWRDHVPHEVAVRFNADEAYQQEYGPHVDSCALCQGLIESIAPRDEVLTAIMQSAEKVPLHEVIDEAVRQLFGPGRHPIPVPMAAFIQSADAPIPVPMLQQLVVAEHSQNPLAQFGAVETCLRLHKPELAYGLLARGLEKCGLEHDVVVRICNAPRFEAFDAEYLLDLSQQGQADTGDPMRAVERLARLGDHAAALQQIGKMAAVQRLKQYAAGMVTPAGHT